MHVAPLAADMAPYYTLLYEHGPERAARVVLRTSEEYRAVVAQVFGEANRPTPAPAVDFTRETVVGYALGRRMTMGGPAPAITAAARRGDTLAIGVRITGCLARDDGMAAPVAFARVPRQAGPVVFVVDSARCRDGR